MTAKNFYIPARDIKRLVEHDGGCIATDRIMVDGRPVGYMYRERPENDADTGWRFMAGDESDEYMDNGDNLGVYAVNTIANYDHDIQPFLGAPIGSAFAHPQTGELEPVESPVDRGDILHPDFPVVTGGYQLTSSWSISLPLNFNRRIEGGSLILWRPGVTLYFIVWNIDHGESIAARLSRLKADISPEAFEYCEEIDGGVRRCSYRLVEEGVHAVYGFAISDRGHVQAAVYLDDPADVELARSMLASIAENGA